MGVKSEEDMFAVYLFFPCLRGKPHPWQAVCVELTGNSSSWDGLDFLIQTAQQLILEACGMVDGSVRRSLYVSLPCLEKKAPGLLLCWWPLTSLGNLESIVNSPQKIGFEFFFCSLCGMFQFLFFFLLRSPINILCRRAWLILHSGGYMSKPHLDSWVKYTGQRNLWGPEKLARRMKRSHHPLFPSTPNTCLFLSLPAASEMPTLRRNATESHVFCQRRLNSV